jgi:hypothetical protein
MLYCIPAVRRAVVSVEGVPWTASVADIFAKLGAGTTVGALVVPGKTKGKTKKIEFVVSAGRNSPGLCALLTKTDDTKLGDMGDPTQTILFAMGQLFDNLLTPWRTVVPELEKVSCHAMFRSFAKCPRGYNNGDPGSWSALGVYYLSTIPLKANECWVENPDPSGEKRTEYPDEEQSIKTVSALLKRQEEEEKVFNKHCKGRGLNGLNKIEYTVNSTCMYVMVSISRNRQQPDDGYLAPIMGHIEADKLVFAVNDGLLDEKDHQIAREPRSFRVIGAILFHSVHYVFVRINDEAEVTHFYDDHQVTIGIPECNRKMTRLGVTVARNAVQLLYRCIDASPGQSRKRARDAVAETSRAAAHEADESIDESIAAIRKMYDDDEKQATQNRQHRINRDILLSEAYLAKERRAQQRADSERREHIRRDEEMARSLTDRAPSAKGARPKKAPTTSAPEERPKKAPTPSAPGAIDLRYDAVPEITCVYDEDGLLVKRMKRIKPTFGSIVRAARMYRA